jgi:hypothetical protein
VIATGFHRDLPAIEPLALRSAAPAGFWAARAEDTSMAQADEVISMDAAAAAESQPSGAMPEAVPEPVREPERPLATAPPPPPPQRPQDDLDTPAFLRRDRRLFH